MKKLFLVAVATVGFAFTGTAQETKFGVKAGVDFASAKQEYDFTSIGGGKGTISSNETGFYVGGFATIGISESFAVQPEVLYVSIKDLNFLSVPVLARYSFAENFHGLAGPSFNYLLDAEEDEFKVNLDFGASYDITENLDINAKYSLGFGDITLNGVFIGAGYSF
ncbi:MAG: PorT family protein [Pedobacter sp.]|nr:MAG: PorT family protein [Pedobacter sp.]